MDKLTREQLEQTWRGLQALSKNVPASDIPDSMTRGFSDTALHAIVKGQLVNLDGNATVGPRFGRRMTGSPDTVEKLDAEDAGAKPKGMRDAARNTIKTALDAPDAAGMDLTSFHALLAANTDQLGINIPDFAFDDKITPAERTAAERIATGLEQGKPVADIQKSFATSATQIKADQAQAETQARLAAEQQQSLTTSADAHFAAAGYIDADQIGQLTDVQRGAMLTQFMKDNATRLQAPGTASAKIGNLAGQQEAAINFNNGYTLNPAALDILRTGVEGAQLGESVETWLESGDPNQIRMAQAAIGHPVTGVLDKDTHTAGTNYIRAGYATDLNDIPAFKGITGKGIDPSQVYDAANNGQLYMPSDADLQAAGMDAGALEAIKAAPDAAELLPKRELLKDKDHSEFTSDDKVTWVSDTRQEMIAQQFMADPELYKRVIDMRNERAQTATVDAEPTALKTEQAKSYEAIPSKVPPGVELPAEATALHTLSAEKQSLLKSRDELVKILEGDGQAEHAKNISALDGRELVDYLKDPANDVDLYRSGYAREQIYKIRQTHNQIDLQTTTMSPDRREGVRSQGKAIQDAQPETEKAPVIKTQEEPEVSSQSSGSIWSWIKGKAGISLDARAEEIGGPEQFKGMAVTGKSPADARTTFGPQAAGQQAEQPTAIVKPAAPPKWQMEVSP